MNRPSHHLVPIVGLLLLACGSEGGEMGQLPPGSAQLYGPTFDRSAGIYDGPVFVAIVASGPVRYTLDGSAPTSEHGVLSESPVNLELETTTVVRVVRLEDDGEPAAPPVTRTFVLPGTVGQQSERAMALPTPTLSIGGGLQGVLDYDVDLDAMGGLSPADVFGAIPTVSLALDPEALLGEGGLLVSGGSGQNSAFEYPVSVELFDPADADLTMQVDAAVRPHSWKTIKRSMKLLFKKDYGPSKLASPFLQHAPLNRLGATSVFDRLVLRAGTNRTWSRDENPDRTTYVRDQLARDLQLAVSGHGVRGTFVHLYLNGLYWGLYNLVERPDHHHAAEYFGGTEDDWFAINHGGVIAGDSTHWDRLIGELALDDLTEPAAWAELQTLLAVDSFLDYVILNFYLGTGDWPWNNWYALQRTAPVSPARFLVWDAEEILDVTWGSDGAWVHPHFLPGEPGGHPITRLWHGARHNPEFMLSLADRVHALCFGDGPLADAAVQERWLALHDFIDTAVAGEAARWGDQLATVGQATRTREATFIPERDRVLEGPLVGNAERLVAALREHGYYPALDPPSISVTASGLVIVNPNDEGVVWVTVDGSDPRSNVAMEWSDMLVELDLTDGSSWILSARVQGADGSWSALAVYAPLCGQSRPRDEF